MRRSRALAVCLFGLSALLTGSVLADIDLAAAQTQVSVRPAIVDPTTVSPNGDGIDDSAIVSVNVGVFDPMDVRWWVETATGLRTGVSGSLDGVTPDDTRDIEFPITPTGLSDGNYRIRVQVKYASDGTWLFSDTTPSDSGGFGIDLTPPPTVTLKRVSPRTFYPIDDEYMDSVFFENPIEETDFYTLVVTDDSNHEVYRHLTWYRPDELYWRGLNDDGLVVPEGTYHVRYELSDEYGNKSVSNSVPVTVSHKRLVWRWWAKKVTPAESLVDRHVGGCSTLRSPSARGWAGSLGLYSNTKCRSTAAASVVSTIHSVRVRKAMDYGQLRVAVDGGAARSAPRSFAVLSYLTARGDWDAHERLGSELRHHPGQTQGATWFVWPDRRFAWRVSTARGERFDVRLFTVKLRYMVLGYRGRCIACPDDLELRSRS